MEVYNSIADVPQIEPFWYLATPYTKYPKGLIPAFVEATFAAALLIKGGIFVFSPIVHSHPIAVNGNLDPRDHSLWLPAHRPILDASGGLLIVKMRGWLESHGIQEEIKAFKAANKPIAALRWPLTREDR